MAIFQNIPLLAALLGILLAQFIKIPITYFLTGKLDWKLMTSTGSMPSSHSAAVTSLTTAIAYESGLASPLFAVSAIFAVIVMFDATGIRYQAGQQAVIINKMRIDFQTFVQEAKGWQQKDEEQKIQELKTLLGHKPSEVLVGALLGIMISVVIYTFII
ncbi:divergent PAP2 family protein [Sporosarcina pasteurii]|uniref:Divergent PAP2 family n=1 Tax=Sporosarcina pasteurii TaxID=1474 RepID=A0A380C9W3_SPOPA|nr:divergent PAP2 family protein [Sporosarcina pasteurii]MDS9472784.1 divergent PAP2 family protein [Sporosarcina pasteurii]QBQ04435.1 divergent PAP2 family protein [Sporosarcina pasteurii]SUJ15082.1 Divergent PAP2 family [Sporosarcina pasteurii]